MEEEKHNPNTHDRLRHNASNSWSELPQDLLNSVFERLSFANFQEAKSVCSSWHSASRQCVPKNQLPWLIFFPDHNNQNRCTLFNPEVKDKLYKSQDLGLKFTNSVCIATYGSWLLMKDPLCNLYIVNLLTNERINLPPVESQLGKTKLERTLDDWFHISNNHDQRQKSKGINIDSPVFCIDEKTKDYVVVWALEEWCVVYAKKGYTSWKQIRKISYCFDMVYKDHKLYFSSCRNIFRIFDFSGEIPKQTFRCGMRISRFDFRPLPSWRLVSTKLVATVTGDVLMVDRRLWNSSGLWSFHVYKVYSSGVVKKYEQVDSLGDEAILLDLGITVLAGDIEGFKRNSIYFNASREKKTTQICLFNLETREMEPFHKFDCSSLQLSSSRWFLPSF